MQVYVLIRMQSGVLVECTCRYDRLSAKEAFERAVVHQGGYEDVLLVECVAPRFAQALPGDVIDESYSQ